MGYTHYWKRTKVLDPVKFNLAVTDIKQLIKPLADADVRLGDGNGKGKPVISHTEICFNGLAKCGHKERMLSLPWPSDTAAGVKPAAEAKVGKWYAGDLLETRQCNGDCSYETFVVPQVFDLDKEPDEKGRYFDFCKTGYRPYDVAVTASLLVLKFRLWDDIAIQSDGEDRDWDDARKLITHVLGYGQDYHVRPVRQARQSYGNREIYDVQELVHDSVKFVPGVRS